MHSIVLFYAAGVAAIGCGIAAGFFLTFSDLVMPSLAAMRNRAGIDAMQMINRRVDSTLSIHVLKAMVLVLPALAAIDLLWVQSAGLPWFALGSILYWLGVLLVSYVFNVPMNHRLGAMNSGEGATESYWQSRFVPRWILWNHVRVVTATASAICCLIAAAVIR